MINLRISSLAKYFVVPVFSNAIALNIFIPVVYSVGCRAPHH